MDWRKILLVLVFGILSGAFLHSLFPIFAPVTAVAIFSPEEGDEIIGFIDSAEESLQIEMYVFTSEDIVDALKRAQDRGVNVQIILERRVATGENPKHYDELLAYGIDIRWASYGYALTHAKFIIADGKRVLVGSHNFSDSAMHRNREASVVLTGNIVEEFKRVFEKDWALAG
jgi:cardiolipin synthase A/B